MEMEWEGWGSCAAAVPTGTGTGDTAKPSGSDKRAQSGAVLGSYGQSGGARRSGKAWGALRGETGRSQLGKAWPENLGVPQSSCSTSGLAAASPPSPASAGTSAPCCAMSHLRLARRHGLRARCQTPWATCFEGLRAPQNPPPQPSPGRATHDGSGWSWRSAQPWGALAGGMGVPGVTSEGGTAPRESPGCAPAPRKGWEGQQRMGWGSPTCSPRSPGIPGAPGSPG